MILTDHTPEILDEIHLLGGKFIYSLSFRKTVQQHEAENEENKQ